MKKYGKYVKTPLVVTRMDNTFIFSVIRSFGHETEDRRRVP